MDIIKNWLIPNITYDLLRSLAVSIIMTVASTALLGPIFKKLKTVPIYLAFGATIFVAVFLLASVLSPQSTPDLVAEPNMIATQAVAQNQQQSLALLILDIVNRGPMASVARNFRLSATIDDGSGGVFAGQMEAVPPHLPMPQSNGRVATLYGGDALYNKTDTPIRQGGEAVGILLFKFNISNEALLAHKVVFTLSFDDALNKSYSTDIPLSASYSRDISYVPGLMMTVSPPLSPPPEGKPLSH